jgi:hypothetical protein
MSYRPAMRHEKKSGGENPPVENVNARRLELPRTVLGLLRIPRVSARSQCFQGTERSSSPTSGTAYPLVRGRICFDVCTKLDSHRSDESVCRLCPGRRGGQFRYVGWRAQVPGWWVFRLSGARFGPLSSFRLCQKERNRAKSHELSPQPDVKLGCRSE